MTAVLLTLAGGLGAALRYLTERAVGPRALLGVNASGSALLGAVVGARPDADVVLVVGTGLCGGFTTLSAASLEAARRGADDEWRRAAVGIVVMLVVCVGAASLGRAVTA